jgi:hypothetical protein
MRLPNFKKFAEEIDEEEAIRKIRQIGVSETQARDMLRI